VNKVTFFLFFFAFLAFGQRAEKVDRAIAARAWDIAVSLPSDTPQISKGGLVIENEVNGIGRRVWLVATNPGTYLLQGKNCSGGEMKLGEVGWEASPYFPVFSMQVLDTVSLQMAAPFMEQLCSIDAIYVAGGKIEKSSAGVNPWAGEAPSLKVGSEGMTPEGQYYVAISLIPSGSVAILGRTSVATEIRSSPMGTSVIFFPPTSLPPVGPTTLTVCIKGVCSSVTFERKLSLTSSPAKG